MTDWHDPVFYFVGNCQAQYLASIVGAATHAPRYFLGEKLAINVAIEGPQATYLDRATFLEHGARATAEGRSTVIIGQETARGIYAAMLQAEGHRFAHHVRVPHLHYKSVWPERNLRKEVAALSDNIIRRNRELERVEVVRKLSKCGIDTATFAPEYWRNADETLNFFSPAHPSGAMFAGVMTAMGEPLRENLPYADEIIAALQRSPGIFQNAVHPIHPRVADILGVAWARTEFYQAWMGLRVATADPEALRMAARRAQAVLDDPALLAVVTPAYHAHFAASLGSAWMKLGRRKLGLPLLQRAVVDLKGFLPLLQQTLRMSVKAGRADIVEAMLVGVAPYVDFTANLHSETYDRTFRRAAGTPVGQEAMRNGLERIGPQFWLHGYLERMLTQAG